MPIWYHGYTGGDAPKQEACEPEGRKSLIPRKETRNIGNPRCFCVETGVKYRTVRECAEANGTSEYIMRRAIDEGSELMGRRFAWCPGRALPPRKPKKKPSCAQGRACMRMDTGERFKSVKELAESLGAPKGTVSHALIVRDKCRGVEIRYCGKEDE